METRIEIIKKLIVEINQFKFDGSRQLFTDQAVANDSTTNERFIGIDSVQDGVPQAGALYFTF